ncbi:hypothetical protein QO017_005591 [Methylobacterium gregans]|nr:hypothetical protein [Methylobacterium gregans]
MARRKAPRIPDAILDQLLAGADPKTAFEADGLLDELKKALAERALNAEMYHHLAGEEGGNTRNGYGRKTVTTETGWIELAIPRDRQATFDPQLIARYQRRFPGFDDKIVSLYARGMSTREIVSHLRELYGIEVSPHLISAVTDTVLAVGRSAFAPLADGLGGDAVALGQHAGALMRAGDLGANRRGGTSLGVDGKHQRALRREPRQPSKRQACSSMAQRTRSQRRSTTKHLGMKNT